MSYHSFSLEPKYENTMLSQRFKEIDKLFSTLSGKKIISDSVPPYDILQLKENFYKLIVSVPGYLEKNLEISTQYDQLIIIGKKEITENTNEKKETVEKILHQEIYTGDFSLSFRLNERISVMSATLDQGLLTIYFEYQIPEKQKIQKIQINVK
uniref:Small heat shock protein ibp n=1 Tax=Buchnera aphidicola subsp. Thelaxes suberi TaxID=98797 RepID=IBP_BUCTS|nr:RecName: Full=Small heat shock protein ibp [Buchnera aphidicola (Thelaxes suberi)]CAA72698.1 hspA [Buchnera aphidicola]